MTLSREYLLGLRSGQLEEAIDSNEDEHHRNVNDRGQAILWYLEGPSNG